MRSRLRRQPGRERVNDARKNRSKRASKRSATVTCVSIGSELPEGVRFIGREPGAPCRRGSCSRRPLRRGPLVLRGVRPVSPPLPHLPADGRGVGVAARADHGDARGERRRGDRRRHVRVVHGSVSGLPGVRGRLPVARAVRPDDGARAGPGGAAAHPASAVRSVAGAGRRPAPPARAAGRVGAPTDRATVPAAPDPRDDPAARRRRSPVCRARRSPPPGVEVRGTVAVLAGCVQDRWFHEVNRATIRVLARNGWRVIVPREQRCCGALGAHNGRLEDGADVGAPQRPGVRGRGPRDRERRGLQRPHEGVRGARGRDASSRSAT